MEGKHRTTPPVLPLIVLLLLIVAANGDAGPETDPETLNRMRALPVEAAIAELRKLPEPEGFSGAIALFRSAIGGGNPEAAGRFLEAAEIIARDGELPAELGEALTTKAYVAHAGGDIAGAIAGMKQAVAHYRRNALHHEEIGAMIYLGNLQHGYGTLDESLTTMEEVISREQEIVDEMTLAHVFSEAAMLRYKLGRLNGVVAFLERALPLYQARDHQDGIGTVYRIYGNYHNALGETALALEYYESARIHYINTNNVHDYANISFNIGLVYLQTGLAIESLTYFENAIENFASAGSPAGAGMAGTELGRALFQLGRYEEAGTIVLQARRHLETGQSYLRLAQAHALYGGIRFTMNDREGAIEAYSDALRLYRLLGIPEDETRMRQAILRIRESARGGIDL